MLCTVFSFTCSVAGTATILGRLHYTKISEGLRQLCLCQIDPLRVSDLYHCIFFISRLSFCMPDKEQLLVFINPPVWHS